MAAAEEHRVEELARLAKLLGIGDAELGCERDRGDHVARGGGKLDPGHVLALHGILRKLVGVALLVLVGVLVEHEDLGVIGNLVQLALAVGENPGDLNSRVLLVQLDVFLRAERSVMGFARVHSLDAHVVVGGGHRLARHARALGHRFGDEVAHVLVLALRSARLPREHELLGSFDLLVVGLGIGLGIVRGAPGQTGHSAHRSNGSRRDELAAIEVEFHWHPSLFSLNIYSAGAHQLRTRIAKGYSTTVLENIGLNLMLNRVFYQRETMFSEQLLRTTARRPPISSSKKRIRRRPRSSSHPARRAPPHPFCACRRRIRRGSRATRRACRHRARPCGLGARPP